MAELIIQTENIKNNIKYLSQYFKAHNIEWSLITKVFSGDKAFLKNILTDDIIANISSVGDSRLTSLKNLRAVNPDMRTIYIKPPAKKYAKEIIKYVDISLNSSLVTIKALNKAAKAANKIHSIIIMIELGELREGVNISNVLDFYEVVFNLSHIKVLGIGSNLGCMYGVEPSYEKLQQLSSYRDIIASRFKKELPYISGGTSITLPLIEEGKVPSSINHFRIGEAAFFGISPLNNQPFKELSTETFLFTANIIELEQKKLIPEGTIGDANIGSTATFDDKDANATSTKIILDFGLLDVDVENITPIDKALNFVGVTSDMYVMDIGNNKEKNGKKKYNIGDKIQFKLNYMAVARLLNSKFIDTVFV
ncbi:MAG: alanine racemase [Chitinophagales bacterium]|nr:alanine racemase [Chitinophagales bacterium]